MDEEKNFPGKQENIPEENSESKTSHVSGEANEEITEKQNENIVQQTLPATAQQPPLTAEPAKTIKEAEQEILQPPTDNMEVHHHPHIHHSKRWKDYLFEFLMLFLAVTAGFFVENKREYYLEHERAKQFSKQLLADLRLDSVLFENRNRAIQSLQKGYDTLLYLLTNKIPATDKKVLETLLPITFAFDVPATATTYNQMKTSGSLRYIENPALTSHLQNYYDVLLPRSIKITDASLAYFSEHINPFYLQHIRIQDYDPFNDSLINKNPIMLQRSKQTDQELANIMGGYRSLLTIQTITMNQPALKKIKETISLLKKEYKLE